MKQPAHITTAEERFADEAKRLRAQAEKLPPGHERDVILRKASLDEAASQMFEWLNSTGPRPPT